MHRKTVTKPQPDGAISAGPGLVKVRAANGKWKTFEVNENGRIVIYSATFYGYVKPPDGPRQEVPLLPDRQAAETMLAELRRIAQREGAAALQERLKGKPVTLLDDLAGEYLEGMEAGGKAPGHVRTERARLTRALKECRLKQVADLEAKDLADRFGLFLKTLAAPSAAVTVPKDEWFSTKQVAALLGVSETAVWKLAKARGVTPDPQPEGRPLYSRDSVLKLVAHRHRGASPRTLNGYRVSLTTFANWLVKRGKIKRAPYLADGLDTKRDTRRQRRAITPEELKQLVSTVRTRGKTIRGLTAETRAIAYQLGFWTMARARAIREARAEDFNLNGDPPTFSIRSESDKTRKARLVPLPKWLAQEIKNWLAGHPKSKAPLFPAPDGMGAIMRADLLDAGLPWETDEGVCDFHALRHSGCTHFLRSGISPLIVAKTGGWAGLQLIHARYGHLIAADLDKALNAAFQAGAGP
jgi:integrase